MTVCGATNELFYTQPFFGTIDSLLVCHASNSCRGFQPKLSAWVLGISNPLLVN